MITLHAAAIVWDFDGTLFNSYLIQKELLTILFERRGIDVPSDDEFLQHYHGHLRDSIHGLSKLEGDELEKLYEEFIYAEEHHYENPHAAYFTDAISLARRAHKAGLKQIIVSNRPHFSDTRLGSPRNLARRPPLEGFIEAVVCGDDNAYHKPDARVLDDTEKQLDVRRSDLLVVGDQAADAELAYNLGAQIVLVKRSDEAIPFLGKLSKAYRESIHIVSDLSDVNVKFRNTIQ
jgi:phosphoglycolate phosphatase-like HAD superfamily hydrolase